MFYNEHAWTKNANMIYLESPAGVGFSYCDYDNCTATDTSTAIDSYDFLVGFFRKFPEFAKNDFFMTGESYAGTRWRADFISGLWEDQAGCFPTAIGGVLP